MHVQCFCDRNNSRFLFWISLVEDKLDGLGRKMITLSLIASMMISFECAVKLFIPTELGLWTKEMFEVMMGRTVCCNS